jgi:hypothetical protein
MVRSWAIPAVVLAVVLAVVAGAVAVRLAADGGTSGSPAMPAPATATATAQPGGRGEPAPVAAATADRPGRCDTVTRGVAPSRITVPGVAPPARVVTPPRDTNGVPGVPPLTARGKTVFAWDRAQGVRPGDPAGNVLLNAHTWPDGSALGNRLLAGLRRGDRIEVVGGGKRLCYRVTERVEVLAEDGLPRYYATDGPPQLAIVVCSGRRLAPGVWERRTVWFAAPVTGGR